MITSRVFDGAHLAELKQALSVYARRHRITAENLANVETPGYRARAYRFEEYLQKSDHQLRGVRTHPEHLPVGQRSLSETQGREVERDTGYDNGVNDVNVDDEMAGLATADLSYRLATRLLSMKYRLLRAAATGQVR
jgi:flagellar basal-body rod protein FlgB